MNQTNPITIIETGLARCVTEPRGSHGLEGYGLGQSYRFERCEDGKGRALDAGIDTLYGGFAVSALFHYVVVICHQKAIQVNLE